MSRTVAFSIAFVLIVSAGLVHGLWADRWGNSEALDQASSRVADVPMQFGDWVGKAVDGDARNFAQAGAQTYFMRSYTHRRTNASVLVILMCGRAGRMAVHTPEVCYRGAGYEVIDAPEAAPVRTELGEELGVFWTSRFEKSTIGTGKLRLYWGWSAGATWEAPVNPRWRFRGQPFLYKLYLSHEAGDSPGSATDSVANSFLRQFLPELNSSLPLRPD